MTFPRAIAFLLLAVFAVFAVSCAKSPTADTPDSTDGLVVETNRDILAVRVRTDHKSLTIADRLKLWLEVDAPEDFEIDLPPVGDKLQQFGIVDFGTNPPVLLSDGRTRRVRHYLLEPFLSGTYKIPPMTIKYRAKGKDGDWAAIETKELDIEVKSELPEGQQDRDIHDIAHSVLPPKPPRTALWLGLIGLVLVVLVSLVCLHWWRRCHQPEVAVVRTPAHELAYAELRELVAANLIEQGMIREFYQGVSDILRRYLERRFGLRAPERTTEEFLAELSTDNALNAEQKQLLKQFLQHCDLVKFAKLAPDETEVQHTFNACKRVIEQTKEATA
jgi:hypothetical protein